MKYGTNNEASQAVEGGVNLMKEEATTCWFLRRVPMLKLMVTDLGSVMEKQ